jgi:ribosomal protein L4
VLVGKAHDAALARAFANLPNVQLRTTRSLRLTDVLVADHLVFVKDAIPALEELRG